LAKDPSTDWLPSISTSSRVEASRRKASAVISDVPATLAVALTVGICSGLPSLKLKSEKSPVASSTRSAWAESATVPEEWMSPCTSSEAETEPMPVSCSRVSPTPDAAFDASSVTSPSGFSAVPSETPLARVMDSVWTLKFMPSVAVLSQPSMLSATSGFSRPNSLTMERLSVGASKERLSSPGPSMMKSNPPGSRSSEALCVPGSSVCMSMVIVLAVLVR